MQFGVRNFKVNLYTIYTDCRHVKIIETLIQLYTEIKFFMILSICCMSKLWVRFPLEEMKYLIFSFLAVVTRRLSYYFPGSPLHFSMCVKLKKIITFRIESCFPQ